jgi:predicted DNA-binding ribbon-helix-helix protein
MTEPAMRGKRVQFDNETFHALDLLARDRMMDFQELADEAFSDLLKKHGRPTDLKSALRQSVSNEGSIRDHPKKTRSPNKRVAS